MAELLTERALARLQHKSVGRIVVAVSGGVDSAVLVHAVAKAGLDTAIEALHVHHGLVENADRLADAAQRCCDSIGIPMTQVAVEVGRAGSLEAAARDARYAAFGDFLRPGDLLLLAHHADDQVETLLFRMFRGSRVAGLQGMPEERQVGQAKLYRPLLQRNRQDIVGYAHQHGLAWVEDESNADTSLDRNYIRHDVLPIIESRWPGVRERLLSALSRDARARSLLEERANERLDLVRLAPDCLDLLALQQQTQDEQIDLLGAWLLGLGIPMPSGGFLREVASAVVLRHRVEVSVGQLEIRQHRDRLYALKPLQEIDPEPFDLELGKTRISGGYIVNDKVKGQGLLAEDCVIRFRRGGETIRQRHQRSLKNLCQESGLPAWLRPRLPLIYRNDELVATAAVPSWDFPMQIAAGHAATGSEAGFAVSLHLDDRF